MDVVERYLENVRTYLPGGKEEDLVAELRENVRAQIEDREERLGRPLSEEERVAVLRAHGRPLLVAGQYRSDGRRLVLGRDVIGPSLFPFFRITLLASGATTGLVLVFVALASTIAGGRPFPFFRTAVFYLALQLGIATLVFAGLEAWFRRTAQTWDPRRLPATRRRTPSAPALRAGAAFQILATGLFLWIWLAVPDPLRFLGPALADLQPGPAWRLLYLGVLASTVLSLVTPALTVVQPAWRRFRWLVSFFSSGVFIAFAAASIWNGAWVLPASIPLDPEAADLARGLNAGMWLGLGMAVVVTAIVTVAQAVVGAWKEFRRPAGASA